MNAERKRETSDGAERLAAIERGIEAAGRGELASVYEVREMFAEWGVVVDD